MFLHMQIQETQELYEVISSHVTKHSDAIFNHSWQFYLNSFLAFYQRVHTLIRGSNPTEYVYTNIPGSCKVLPHPHFGVSDLVSSANLFPADKKGQIICKNYLIVDR